MDEHTAKAPISVETGEDSGVSVNITEPTPMALEPAKQPSMDSIDSDDVPLARSHSNSALVRSRSASSVSGMTEQLSLNTATTKVSDSSLEVARLQTQVEKMTSLLHAREQELKRAKNDLEVLGEKLTDAIGALA
jgi:outer membrane murein-binding lipoprotein Lpp